MAKLTKDERHQQIRDYLQHHPFSTDEELSSHFQVSIQTVRLDRMTLGIPEVRQRMKAMAHSNYNKVKSLADKEVIGHLVDVELDKRGISVMDVETEMVFAKTGVARGHYLFAQVNSLAVAIVDEETALTGSASVSYKKPVYLGEKVVAKAEVVAIKGKRRFINVEALVNTELVLTGKFVVFGLESKEGSVN